MADPAPYDETGTDAGAPATHEGPPRRPRWVKISAIVGLALVLLVGVMLLVGGGNHGPGRHGGDDSGTQTPPAGITEPGGAGGHTPPPGGHGP